MDKIETETAAVAATGLATATAGSSRRRMCFAPCCATIVAEPCSTTCEDAGLDATEGEAEAGANAMQASCATDRTGART